MFTDQRSRKIVLVAHCILNQNAKLDRCAHYPGIFTELLELLVRSGAGILQMPCPELLYLGLDRQAGRGQPASIASEDTRIARLMQAQAGRAFCAKLVQPLIEQVRQYRKENFKVIGLIGVNGSPTCGVETNWAEDTETSGPGVFIQAVQEAFEQDHFALPVVGVKTYQPEKSLAAVREAFGLS